MRFIKITSKELGQLNINMEKVLMFGNFTDDRNGKTFNAIDIGDKRGLLVVEESTEEVLNMLGEDSAFFPEFHILNPRSPNPEDGQPVFINVLNVLAAGVKDGRVMLSFGMNVADVVLLEEPELVMPMFE